jgi:chromosome segregation ATPase
MSLKIARRAFAALTRSRQDLRQRAQDLVDRTHPQVQGQEDADKRLERLQNPVHDAQHEVQDMSRRPLIAIQDRLEDRQQDLKRGDQHLADADDEADEGLHERQRVLEELLDLVLALRGLQELVESLEAIP